MLLFGKNSSLDRFKNSIGKIETCLFLEPCEKVKRGFDFTIPVPPEQNTDNPRRFQSKILGYSSSIPFIEKDHAAIGFHGKRNGLRFTLIECLSERSDQIGVGYLVNPKPPCGECCPKLLVSRQLFVNPEFIHHCLGNHNILELRT